MQLVILPSGTVRCVYGESIDLNKLGAISISRGSHVEPDHDGQWMADLSPVDGPQLGPFARRSDALKAEAKWLNSRWLVPPRI